MTREPGPGHLVDRLREANPQAADLATLCSLACRVEPELLRRLRLLLPGADVAAESDLWTSGLLAGATVSGIALDPRVADLLRDDLRLARWDRYRADAASLVAASHAGLHWSLRLEEQLNLAMVEQAPPERSRDLVLAAVRELAGPAAGLDRPAQLGIARWLLSALARLPGPFTGTDYSAAARLAGDLHVANRPPVLAAEPGSTAALAQERWLPWLLSTATGTDPVPIRFAAGRLEVNATGPGDDTVSVPVPRTEPMVLDLAWLEGGQPHAERITFGSGERAVREVLTDRVELTSLTGSRWLLRDQGAGRDAGGFDFSTQRASHRPCLARDELLERLPAGGSAVITGPRGAGKTVVLCALADRWEEQGYTVVQHFFGVEPAWDRPDLVTASLLAQLQSVKAPGAPIVMVLDGVTDDMPDDLAVSLRRGPFAEVTSVVTARRGAAVGEWPRGRPPVELGGADEGVCAAMVRRRADHLLPRFAGGDEPFSAALIELAGGNPGRLATIMTWILDQPDGTVTPDTIPPTLTAGAGDALVACERIVRARTSMRDPFLALACVAVALPGLTVADLSWAVTGTLAPGGGGAQVAPDMAVLLAAAAEARLIHVDGMVNAGNSVVTAQPGLAETLAEQTGDRFLVGRAHDCLSDGVIRLDVDVRSTYQMSSGIFHALRAKNDLRTSVVLPDVWMNGAFLHRRATEFGVQAALADLTAACNANDPVLHAARVAAIEVADEPEWFVDVIANLLRRNGAGAEADAFLAGYLSPAWTPTLAVRAVRADREHGRAGLAFTQLPEGPADPRRVPFPEGISAPSRITALDAFGGLTVAGCADGTVLLVDRGRNHPLVGHIGEVTAVAGTPAWFVTAGADGTVRVWDVPSRRTSRVLRHQAPVRRLTVVAEGLVVTADANGRVLWWDPATGEQFGPPIGHGCAVTTLTRVGDEVVSTGEDGSILCSGLDGPDRDGADPVTRTTRTVVWCRGGRAVRLATAVGTMGLLVTWDDDNRLRWWSAGVLRGTVHPGVDQALALHATSDPGNHVTLVHRTGEVTCPPPTSAGDDAGNDHLRLLAVAADGRVAIAEPDGVWLSAQQGHGDWTRYPASDPTALPVAIAYLPDGSLAVVDSEALHLDAVNLPIRMPAVLITTASAAGLALCFEAGWVGVVVGDNTLPDSRARVRTERPTAMAMVTADLVAVGEETGVVTVVRLDGPASEQAVVSTGRGPVTALAGVGSWLVAGTADGTLLRWRVDGGTPVTFGRHRDTVEAMTPAGDYLVSVSRDRTMRLWDVEHGTELGRVLGAEPFVAVVNQPGTGRVLARAADGGLWIVDVDTPGAPGGDLFDVPSTTGATAHATVRPGPGGSLDVDWTFTLNVTDFVELRAADLAVRVAQAPCRPVTPPTLRLGRDGRVDEPIVTGGRLAVPRRLAAGQSIELRLRQSWQPPDGVDLLPLEPCEIICLLGVAGRFRQDDMWYLISVTVGYDETAPGYSPVSETAAEISSAPGTPGFIHEITVLHLDAEAR